MVADSAAQMLVVMAVLAVLPVAAVLYVGAGRGEGRPRLSPGRFFLFYAVVFAALLLCYRYLSVVAALSLLGVLLGVMGSGSGVTTLYRFLYGRAWLEAHPGAVRADVARWQLPMMVAAVIVITAALVVSYPLLRGGGAG